MKPIARVQILIAAITTLVIFALIAFAMNGSGTSEPTPTPVPVPTEQPPSSPSSGKCVIGGCSSEICSDADAGPVMSACMYRADFACYQSATCERQRDGECGWTRTKQLSACLKNPPAI